MSSSFTQFPAQFVIHDGRLTPYGGVAHAVMLRELIAHYTEHPKCVPSGAEMELPETFGKPLDHKGYKHLAEVNYTPVLWRCEIWGSEVTHAGYDSICKEPMCADDIPSEPELWLEDHGHPMAVFEHPVTGESISFTSVLLIPAIEDQLVICGVRYNGVPVGIVPLANLKVGEIIGEGDAIGYIIGGRRFMNTTSVVSLDDVDAIAGLPRSERRRAKNVGRPLVRIVNLRRQAPSGASSGHGGHTYSCRWIVRAHWRKQWMPSLAAHKTIPIAPHLKGPEGAPLKPSATRLIRVAR